MAKVKKYKFDEIGTPCITPIIQTRTSAESIFAGFETKEYNLAQIDHKGATFSLISCVYGNVKLCHCDVYFFSPFSVFYFI